MGSEDISAESVRAALGKHGYGFQYAVIREIRRLYRPGAAWQVDGTEFPVQVRGVSTHVDLTARSKHGLLVCECKRVDPALGIWCFGRSVLATSYDREGQVIIHETLSFGDPEHDFVVDRRDPRVLSDAQYHVALEIKTNEKGESQGTNRGALEDAITQALKGVSGVTNAIAEQRRLMGSADRLTIIPVIITTARLVTCETDLSTADLATGRLPERVEITERPWLWFRRASTPALRHEQVVRLPKDVEFSGFNETLNMLLVRSIGIVSTASEDGLERFLHATAVHVGDDF
jgi:hypothetical protein